MNKNGIKTITTQKIIDKEYESTTAIANYLAFIVSSFNGLIDDREEWEKDRWDVRNLQKYGITYNNSTANYFVDFNKINNIKIRKEIKNI